MTDGAFSTRGMHAIVVYRVATFDLFIYFKIKVGFLDEVETFSLKFSNG